MTFWFHVLAGALAGLIVVAALEVYRRVSHNAAITDAAVGGGISARELDKG